MSASRDAAIQANHIGVDSVLPHGWHQGIHCCNERKGGARVSPLLKARQTHLPTPPPPPPRLPPSSNFPRRPDAPPEGWGQAKGEKGGREKGRKGRNSREKTVGTESTPVQDSRDQAPPPQPCPPLLPFVPHRSGRKAGRGRRTPGGNGGGHRKGAGGERNRSLLPGQAEKDHTLRVAISGKMAERLSNVGAGGHGDPAQGREIGR